LSKPLNFHVLVPDENKEEEDDDDEDEGDEDDDDEDEEDDENNNDDDDDDDDDDDEDNDIDFFTSPEIDSSDEVFVMESLNDSVETEIILWVFKF
jgi:ABC-type Zn2+ transport system substrate-binding protein/surface adhesin